MVPMRAAAGAWIVVSFAVAQSGNKPQQVASRAIGKLVSVPFTENLWSWSYGAAIEMSAMWEISGPSGLGQNWTSSLNKVLDSMLTNQSLPAYKALNNITMSWDAAIGDNIGLMPIAFLSRAQYYGEAQDSLDYRVATIIASQYVARWPKRLPDGTISRDTGWTGEPDVNASFLWCDDQFMGTALLSRLARSPYTDPELAASYVDFVAHQQVQFASYMQESSSGLFLHGYNHATGDLSCCKWGRANGWVMMSHAEVVTAIEAVSPGHPLLPQILNIWRTQAAGLVAVQNTTDGRWHQVLNESSTFLETSVTAMTLYSMVTGVLGGWLDKASLDSVIRQAWVGLANTVDPDGTVEGISCGTGVGTTVEFYQQRPTSYSASAPGLGSVFRAALAYADYTAAYGE